MSNRRHKAPSYYKSPYGEDDEYTLNHDLSDDDNQIPGSYSPQAVPVVPSRPSLSFDEVFQYLLDYHNDFKKWPPLGDLHSMTGSFTQPMSLNVVSHSLTWHMTLADFACGKLITTMLDQEKSKGCNNYMFEEPNPEAKPKGVAGLQAGAAGGKNKLLKLQVVFNMQQMPEHI